MEYRDYSHYSQNTNIQEHENIHKLLQDLDRLPNHSTDKKVTEVAKHHLKPVFGFLFTPHKEIFNAAKVLMNDVVAMKSFSEAQQEISGAINGLNILLRHETNQSTQQLIKKELEIIAQYNYQVKNFFLLKEALAEDSKLEKLLYEPRFLEDFNALAELYGRGRTIDPPLILAFSRFWNQKEGSLLWRKFLDAASQKRQETLSTLKKGDLPLEADLSDPLVQINSTLNQFTAETLETKDYRAFKILVDEIFGNRAMVTNSQLHTDGLLLAFNSGDDSTLSTRLKDTIQSCKKKYDTKLEELQSIEKGDEKDSKKMSNDLKNWQKLEGYRPRPIGTSYEKSEWSPEISAGDPIQPLERVIGFAVKEGRKNESRTPLNFHKILGENNSQLTVAEKVQLSKLLKACDSFATKHPNILKEMDQNFKIPASINEVLKSFDNPEWPHLKTLTSMQQEALVREALRFAFEVNYNLANDLLNLS